MLLFKTFKQCEIKLFLNTKGPKNKKRITQVPIWLLAKIYQSWEKLQNNKKYSNA